jgi:hypothetical protein
MIRANAKPLVFRKRSETFRAGANARNLLLDRLPHEVRDRIETELRCVSLLRGQIVHKPGDNIRYLYFPTTCMISVTVTMRDGRTVEAGAARFPSSFSVARRSAATS